MKVELKLLCFIISGALGNIGLLNAPFIVQVFMIPIIGGFFGYAIYKLIIEEHEVKEVKE